MDGSPFAKPSSGPSISPATMGGTQRGGQQNPAYLQMRKPLTPGNPQTKPVVTPAASVVGDTVNPLPPVTPVQPQGPQPQITPAGAKPQAGGQGLGDVYNFFKSDLQNQAKQAKSGAIANASSRGVYYGTPLTGSEADIDTQYLRGLGQLDAGMYSNEQQNQLSRLGMAVQLNGQGGNTAPPSPEGMDWSGLGALFGSNPTVNPSSKPRQGPAVTPTKPATPPYDPAGLTQ